jgi:hypothetical protein
MLARPVTPIEHINAVYNRGQTLTHQPSRLDVLSMELLDMVVEHLIPEKKDLISFGLTSEFH